MKFSDLARECLLYMSMRGMSQRTVTRYDFVYGEFREFLAMKKLDNEVRHFNDQTLAAYVTERGTHGGRRGQGIKPNSLRIELSALSTLAKFGMKRKNERGQSIMFTDPTRTFGDWPIHQRSETKFLYLPEQAAFLTTPAAINEDFARHLLWETGLRVSEAARANVCDLIHEGDSWFLSVTVKGRGRQDERVHVPLSADLGAMWERWEAQRLPRPEEPLLVNKHGYRWGLSALTTMTRRLAKRAGITRFPVSAHKLRHTANVNARLAGLDPEQRRRLLNHSSTKTLEVYDHLLPGELEQAKAQVTNWARERIQSFVMNPTPEQRTAAQSQDENPTR